MFKKYGVEIYGIIALVSIIIAFVWMIAVIAIVPFATADNVSAWPAVLIAVSAAFGVMSLQASDVREGR